MAYINFLTSTFSVQDFMKGKDVDEFVVAKWACALGANQPAAFAFGRKICYVPSSNSKSDSTVSCRNLGSSDSEDNRIPLDVKITVNRVWRRFFWEHFLWPRLDAGVQRQTKDKFLPLLQK
jgi:hypothetical protein